MQENAEADYVLLTRLLNGSDRALEIDILPSHLTPPSQVQYSVEDGALAISKVMLVKYFVSAHRLFFSQRDSTSISSENRLAYAAGNGQGTKSSLLSPDILVPAKSVFESTSILLLWDPNYTTAINYRKRYILRHSPDLSAQCYPTEVSPLLAEEFILLASLVTSPLPKHAKSPTLWSHRLWLVQLLFPLSILSNSCPPDLPARASAFLDNEFTIILAAATRHPHNYYAWSYARDLLRHFGVFDPCTESCWARTDPVSPIMQRVKTWCLKHPRDISAWTFWPWLIEQPLAMNSHKQRPMISSREEISNLREEVARLTRAFGWAEGQSVRLFLSRMGRLLE